MHWSVLRCRHSCYLTKEPALSGYGYSNRNAMGIVVVVDRGVEKQALKMGVL
jgi:hypothetical protein